MKLWVYIASPYTHGDVGINVRTQHELWDELLDLGFTPIAPLWSHYQHLHRPRKYSDWMIYDTEIIGRCDVCLRMSGRCDELGYAESRSNGADAEVALFKQLKKPVVYSVLELVEYQRRLAECQPT